MKIKITYYASYGYIGKSRPLYTTFDFNPEDYYDDKQLMDDVEKHCKEDFESRLEISIGNEDEILDKFQGQSSASDIDEIDFEEE